MSVTNVSVSDTYDALLTTTLRNFQPNLADNIFQELPFLFWLTKGGRKKKTSGGYQFAVPLLYGENTTVGTFEGYDVLDITPQEGITTAFWDWANLAVSISISRDEEIKNKGAHRLVNLLDAKVQQAEKSAQWYLADIIHGIHGNNATTYVGGGASTVDSLGGGLVATDAQGRVIKWNSLDHLVRMAWGMVANTAATRAHYVGGVTVSTTQSASNAYGSWGDIALTAYTNPWWMNYSNPGFGRISRGADGGVMASVLSTTELANAGDYNNATYSLIDAMRSMYNRVSDGSDSPDLILCGQEPYEAYEAMLMPLERFENKSMGDAGFRNLKFYGATIMLDHGIRTRIPTTEPTAAPKTASVAALATANSPTPMYFLNSKYLEWKVESDSDFITTEFKKPINQLARTAQIVLTANLATSNRRKHGVLSIGNFTNGWSATD